MASRVREGTCPSSGSALRERGSGWLRAASRCAFLLARRRLGCATEMDIVAKCACAALLFATSAGIMSCAKPYQMPPETLAFRRTLDDTRALAIVNDLIRAKKGRGDGMYEAAMPERTVVLNPRVEGAHIAFDTFGPQISASSQPELDCWAPTGELVAVAEQVPTRCTSTFDLRGISLLSVSLTPGDPAGPSVTRPRAPSYTIYAMQGLMASIYINVATADLGPLLAALTHLSPAARVSQGHSITRPSTTGVPSRVPSDVAILRHIGCRVAIDGQPPASCEDCDVTLKPGAHQFRVQYWERGFLDKGMEVTLLPNGGAIAGPAPLGNEILLVKSRTARDLTVTLLGGHKYYLVTRTNRALDDWYVEVIDEAADAPVVSDRAAHCKECESDAPIEATLPSPYQSSSRVSPTTRFRRLSTAL